MNAAASSAITALVGLAAILAATTGTYTNYVKVGLKWPLIISGLVLIAAGTASLIIATRRQGAGHSHTTPAIGALLVVFVTALALAPPPLGAAAAADRVPNRVFTTASQNPIGPSTSSTPILGETPTEPLPSTTVGNNEESQVVEPETTDELKEEQPDASVPSTGTQPGTPAEQGSEPSVMRLYDFIDQTYSAPRDVIGTPLQLIGFAAPEPTVPGAFRLTRYVIGCCASDAFPLQITLSDPPFVPDDDQWVAAEVVWNGDFEGVDPATGSGVPVLEVLSLTRIDAPADPYES